MRLQRQTQSLTPSLSGSNTIQGDSLLTSWDPRMAFVPTPNQALNHLISQTPHWISPLSWGAKRPWRPGRNDLGWASPGCWARPVEKDRGTPIRPGDAGRRRGQQEGEDGEGSRTMGIQALPPSCPPIPGSHSLIWASDQLWATTGMGPTS